MKPFNWIVLFLGSFVLLLVVSLSGGTPPVLAETSQIVSALVNNAPIQEVEPNNTSDSAQVLTAIGRENYVIASINPANDRDWFRFDAVAGQTYVIEIFEASASFNTVTGNNCDWDSGVGLRIFDASVTQITASCRPNSNRSGAGNVHNIIQFSTGINSEFYIQVVPNNSTVTGDYKLRVLPQYNHPSASWDSNYEPNNQRITAAPIQIGRENAISASIEQRIANYATNHVDIDWYWFTAEADKTYTVELFNAAANFNAASSYDNCGWDSGIGLLIVDASGTVLASECRPNENHRGSGNVHNIVQFTPGLAGDYFIQVIPNENNRYGAYQLRVLPPYDDPLASWDDNHEPNNRRATAAPIQVGRENVISSFIEERIANYSTNRVDSDWYQFEAEANKTYTIELLNAAANFNAASSYDNCGWDSGIGLLIFDASGTVLASECRPNENRSGSGNVHNIIQFTPGLAGDYFIEVIPNENARYGNYQLRVLPPHNDLLASWDANYEPNNRPANAYLLQPGRLLSTNIEARITTYSTNRVDQDWYRVQAVAGQTYTIETVNVAPSLATASGTNCRGTGTNRTGLGIVVFDSTVSTRIAEECVANGQGQVHTTASFTAGLTGTYYVWVIPNSQTASGNYGVRLVGTFEGEYKAYLPMVRR
jgi:O-acetyl-ADP-ribose deacetylase (regulator of RNase III)